MENSWLIEASSILPVWKIWQQKNTVEKEKQRTQSNHKIQLRQYNKPIRPRNEWMQPAVSQQSAIERTWSSHDWSCFYYWLVEKKEPNFFNQLQAWNSKTSAYDVRMFCAFCAQRKKWMLTFSFDISVGPKIIAILGTPILFTAWNPTTLKKKYA